jgi:hypothetical protein
MNQHLEMVAEKDYSGQQVRIDNRHFLGCNLTKSILIWSGKTALQTNCTLDGCQVQFEGEAMEFFDVLQAFHFKVDWIYHPET